VTSGAFVLESNHCLHDADDRSAGVTPANYLSGILSGAGVEGSIQVVTYNQGPLGSCDVRCGGCRAYLGIRFKSDETPDGRNAMQVGNYVLLKSKVREGPAAERVFADEFEEMVSSKTPVGASAHNSSSSVPGAGVGLCTLNRVDP
jgi:hypothetical protein